MQVDSVPSRQAGFVRCCLYALATKYPNPEQRPTSPTGHEHLLLAYAADGSAIEEAADFGEAVKSYMQPIAHRGYLWMVVKRGNGSYNPAIGSLNGQGWELVGYELATGKTVTIFSTLPPADENMNYKSPDRLFADGDYLYFNIDPKYKASPDTKSGLIRISLETGEVKQMLEKNVGFVENGCTFYASAGVTEEMFIVNLESGEKISLGKNSKSDQFIATKDYLICKYYQSDPRDAKNSKSILRFYRYDGSMAGETEMPYDWLPENMAAKDGNLYFYFNPFDEHDIDSDHNAFHHHDYVTMANLAAFMQGNTETQTVYTMEFDEKLHMYP